MRKFISASVAAFALIAAQAASAQTFATTPGTYTFSGFGVSLQKDFGPLLSCNLSIDITNYGNSITADNVVFTGAGGFCDAFFFRNEPYVVTVSGSTVSISGIYLETYFPAGDCSGFIDATFSLSGTTEELLIDTGFGTGVTLPEVSASTGECKILGVISNP